MRGCRGMKEGIKFVRSSFERGAVQAVSQNRALSQWKVDGCLRGADHCCCSPR